MSGGRGDWAKRRRIKRRLMAVERVCWLCLQPLDFTIGDRRDPRFVVVDECLPVSKGGDCLDANNCHLVHNRCNGRKGARILPRGAFAEEATGGPIGPRRTSRDWSKGCGGQ